MAQNTEELDQQVEDIIKTLVRFNEGYDVYFKDLEKLTKGTKEYREAQAKLWKNLQSTLDTFNNRVKKGTAGFNEFLQNLERLDDALANSTSAEQRRAIQKNKEEIAAAARRKAVEDASAEAAKKVANSATASTGQFVKSLQNGASATELSTGVMNFAVDTVGATTIGVGKALQGLGASAVAASVATGGWTAVIGGAAVVAGSALQFVGESGTKLAKFGISVLSKEVERTVKAFNTLSASGAFFANGMTGMRDAATATGLTLEQFSKVVSENSRTLASAGIGVTDATRMLGDVGKVLKSSGLQRNLMLLGYGFEEQAALTAEVMADMRQAQIGPLQATSGEIAQQTAKYAENLRIISAVTGEDAKKKMDQVRQQSTQLAFQQKLAGMDETQRRNVVNAMANMSELQRKNYMDMVVFGNVINKEGAAAAALSTGLRDSVQESYRDTLAGTLDDQRQREINKQYGAQIQKDILGLTSIGMAGAANVGGLAQALAEAFGKELQERKVMTKESIEQAERYVKSQENLQKGTDDLTDGVINASIAAQQLAIDIQELLLPLVGEYAKATADMLGVIEDAVNSIRGELPLDNKQTAAAKSTQKYQDSLRQRANPYLQGPDVSMNGEEIERWAAKRRAVTAKRRIASDEQELARLKALSEKSNAYDEQVLGTKKRIAQLEQNILRNKQALADAEKEKTDLATSRPKSEISRAIDFKDANGKLVERRMGGTRSWRNNNPGNIEYGDFAIAHGAIGSDGRFAIFPNMEMGRRAQDALQMVKSKQGKTIEQATRSWAPASENDTEAYLRRIKEAGIDTSKSYKDLSSKEKGKLLDAQREIEGYGAGTVRKFAGGGTIPAGDIGIVGEVGPEIVAGPANVTKNSISAMLIETMKMARANTANSGRREDTSTGEVTTKDAVAHLYQSLNQIYLMMSEATKIQGEGAGAFEGMYYKGDPNSDDFQIESWIQNNTHGYEAGTNAVGIAARLEDMLQDLQDPEKRRAKQEENVIQGSLTQDNMTNEAIKEFAKNAVLMVEELKRVSDAMNENNRMTSGILQNTQ